MDIWTPRSLNLPWNASVTPRSSRSPQLSESQDLLVLLPRVIWRSCAPTQSFPRRIERRASCSFLPIGCQIATSFSEESVGQAIREATQLATLRARIVACRS